MIPRQLPVCCCVCGDPQAEITIRAMNALPIGTPICVACKEAIKRAEVGIAQRADGSIHVTDGRAA